MVGDELFVPVQKGLMSRLDWRLLFGGEGGARIRESKRKIGC